MKNKFVKFYLKDSITKCWNWIGSKDRYGYGRFGKHQKAHRAVFEYLKKEIPKEMDLDHLCKNKSCVNPKHLEIVTNQENVQRGKCAKLTPSKIREIRKIRSEGKLLRDIAPIFNVSDSTI